MALGRWLHGNIIPVAVVFVATAVLYWPVRSSFFVFDDLSILRIACARDSTWRDCLGRMSNGFWRPVVLVGARGVWLVCGYAPFGFHVACWMLHGMVALLTCSVAQRLGMTRSTAIIACLLFVSHLGAWPAVSRYATSCDLFLAFFSLGCTVTWQRWLQSGGPGRLALCGILMLLAFGSKETAVVLPVALGIITLERRRRARDWQIAGALAVIAAALAASVLVGQGSVQSYIGTGYVHFSVKALLRQFLDYWAFAACPYLHIMEPAIATLKPSHLLLWVVRAAYGRHFRRSSSPAGYGPRPSFGRAGCLSC